MASFQFRLEKVWQHRRRIVDGHSLAVAQANRLVSVLSRRIVILEGDIDRQARSMVSDEGVTLSHRELIAGTTWLDHLRRLREDLDHQLQTAVKDLERFRSRLTESRRDLEVLSRLGEKQSEVWHEGQLERQLREMDEIGQVRAFRHRATKGSS